MIEGALRQLWEMCAGASVVELERRGARHVLGWFGGRDEDVVLIVARGAHAAAFRRLAARIVELER